MVRLSTQRYKIREGLSGDRIRECGADRIPAGAEDQTETAWKPRSRQYCRSTGTGWKQIFSSKQKIDVSAVCFVEGLSRG